MTTTERNRQLTLPRIPWWFAALLFAAIALFFLWEEHEAHIRGALPWLLFLACPLIHLLMHRGHGHGGGADDHDHERGGS